MSCITTPVIDCESFSISIEPSGIVNISLTVFSTSTTLPGSNEISVRVNNRTYDGFVVAHQATVVNNLPLSAMNCNDPIYQHQLTIQATSF